MIIKSLKILCGVGILGAGIFSIIQPDGDEKNQILKVGVPGQWTTLTPGKQSDAYASFISGYQYESLLYRSPTGELLPHAAKFYSFNPSHTRFEFEINPEKRFSDGQRLRPGHFVSTWTRLLRQEKQSSLRNLRELMSRLVGYESFEKTGEIAGLTATDDRLILEFNRPFRTALEYLSIAKSAAFIEKDGAILGTGRYVIEEREDQLVFTPNRYYADHQNQPRIAVKVIPVGKAAKALLDGEIDIYTHAGQEIPAVEDQNIKRLERFETSHVVLTTNNSRGIFRQKDMRRGLLFLIAEWHKRHGTRFNPQLYLNYQAGHLPDHKVERIIQGGARFTDELIRASIKKPLTLLTSESTANLPRIFQDAGIRFIHVDKSGGFKKRLDHYMNADIDLILLQFSIHNTDPDGVYHFMGKWGAVRSEMIDNDQIMTLLEKGRSLHEPSSIGLLYTQVSETFLREAPFIHLGFGVRRTFYHPDRLTIDTPRAVRHGLIWHLFTHNR